MEKLRSVGFDDGNESANFHRLASLYQNLGEGSGRGRLKRLLDFFRLDLRQWFVLNDAVAH